MQSQKTKKFFTFTSRISSAVLICNTEKEEPGLCVLMSLLVTPALAPEPQALELIWDHPFPFQGLRKSCPPWHTPSRLPAPLKKDRKSVRVCEECTCDHSQVIVCFHLPPAAACAEAPAAEAEHDLTNGCGAEKARVSSLHPGAYNLEMHGPPLPRFCLLLVPSSCWELCPCPHSPPQGFGSFGSCDPDRQV